MISGLFFTWFLISFLTTVNALRRPVPPHRRFPPLWLPAMLVSELAPVLLVVRALIAILFLAAAAAQTTVGQAGLLLFALSELGLLVLVSRTIRAAREITEEPPLWSLFRIWDRLPAEVEVTPKVHYWDDLTLDVYRRSNTADAPTLIYVHPGSWMRGRPGRQARSMFHLLASRNWVILDIRYPLSPAATFPEHLIGVKRAIQWARNGGSRFGVDPRRVAVSGGSSGAHLAALAALTWDRPDLQPGFETADTSVVGCLPFYGIYDLLVRNPTRYDWPFIARYVMKSDPTESPELYTLGSPVDQVRPDAPPFLVVHGEFDSIVLPAESRHLVDAMRNVGGEVEYLEIPGAQHGFDAIASLRSRATAVRCVRWLERVASR